MQLNQQIEGFFANNPWAFVVLILIALWTIPWKGVALWHAAKRGEFWWFIVMLVLNDLALLELFYVLYWTRRKAAAENMQSINERP